MRPARGIHMITAFAGDRTSFENERINICGSIAGCLGEQEAVYGYAIPGEQDPDPAVRRSIADALYDAAIKDSPDIIIFMSTACSREYAGRLACRLGIPCIPNTERIERQGDTVILTLPAYNGALQGKVTLCGKRAVILMDEASVTVKECADPGIIVREIDIPDVSAKLRRERRTSADTENDDISLAEKAVVCGHAFTKGEQMEELRKFERLSGAAAGGSRPVVTDGLLPVSRLTGMSGKVLKADRCLVLGASGAAAFRAGIKNCREVIAVNTDSDAPVFRAAGYGAVADCHIILKEMNRLLEEKDGSR